MAGVSSCPTKAAAGQSRRSRGNEEIISMNTRGRLSIRALVLMALALVGCLVVGALLARLPWGGPGAPVGTLRPRPIPKSSPLALRLLLDRARVEVGGEIALDMSVVNCSERPIVVCQRMDPGHNLSIDVVDTSRKTVLTTWPDAVVDVIGPRPLDYGEVWPRGFFGTREQIVTGDEALMGIRVGPGTYYLRATWYAERGQAPGGRRAWEGQLTSPWVKLEVTRPRWPW